MRRALFLDRDGVINEDAAYVGRIEDFRFIEGVFPLLREALRLGYLPVVVTNQAGIGRGFYSEADFEVLNGWMLEEFEKRGIRIERVYHCPDHPTHGIGEYRRDSFDRKPKPGMLLRARDELGIDMAASVLIGDKDSDIEAGRRAGVGRLIAVQGSYPLTAAEDVTIVHSPADAAELLS